MPDELSRAYDGVVRAVGRKITNTVSGTLEVRFNLNTVDGVGHTTDDGWYIDNVRIYECP